MKNEQPKREWILNVKLSEQVQQCLALEYDIVSKVTAKKYLDDDSTSYTFDIVIQLPQKILSSNELLMSVAKVLNIKHWTNVTIDSLCVFSSSIHIELNAEVRK